MSYILRRATVDDIAELVHHRTAMFCEMGVEGDYVSMERAFADWLRETIPSEVYRAWVTCDGAGEVVAGCGMVLHVKAPAPQSQLTRSAYVYNVYVEPEHRQRGLARQLMETIHDWCRSNDIHQVSLHASTFGRHLYESMGYEATNEMRIRLNASDEGQPGPRDGIG